jgi:hypothetical protein
MWESRTLVVSGVQTGFGGLSQIIFDDIEESIF